MLSPDRAKPSSPRALRACLLVVLAAVLASTACSTAATVQGSETADPATVETDGVAADPAAPDPTTPTAGIEAAPVPTGPPPLALSPDGIFFDLGPDYVFHLAVFDDGRIVSGGGGTVEVRDPNNLQNPTAIYRGHVSTIRSAIPLADGRIASAASNDIHIWHPENPLAPPTIIAGPDDGDATGAIVELPDGRLVSGGTFSTRVIDLANLEETPPAFGKGGEQLTVLDDGRIASVAIFSSEVHVWSPTDPSAASTVYSGHSSNVTGLAQLDDGRIATGEQDGAVHLWDPNDPSAAEVSAGTSAPVEALDALPDGRLVSGNGSAIQVWDVNAIDPAPLTFTPAPGLLQAVVGLPDGRFVSATDRTMQLWDPANPDVDPIEFFGHAARVTASAVLTDGRIVAVGIDNVVRVLDPTNPESEGIEYTGHVVDVAAQNVTALAVLADDRIVIAATDSTEHIWDPNDPSTEAVIYDGQSGIVRDIARFDGNLVAAASQDGSIQVWDPDNLNAAPRFAVDQPGVPIGIAVLDDGRLAVSTGQDVNIWNPNEPGASPITYATRAFGVIPLDDGRIAIGDWTGVLLVSPDSPDVDVRRYTGHDLVAQLLQLADGRIASASADGTVHIWDPQDVASIYDPDATTPAIVIEANGEGGLHQLEDGQLAIAGFGVRIIPIPPR